MGVSLGRREVFWTSLVFIFVNSMATFQSLAPAPPPPHQHKRRPRAINFLMYWPRRFCQVAYVRHEKTTSPHGAFAAISQLHGAAGFAPSPTTTTTTKQAPCDWPVCCIAARTWPDGNHPKYHIFVINGRVTCKVLSLNVRSTWHTNAIPHRDLEDESSTLTNQISTLRIVLHPTVLKCSFQHLSDAFKIFVLRYTTLHSLRTLIIKEATHLILSNTAIMVAVQCLNDAT